MEQITKTSLLVSWIVFVVCLIGMAIIFSFSYSGWMLVMMILFPGIIISEIMSMVSFFMTRWIMMGIGTDMMIQRLYVRT